MSSFGAKKFTDAVSRRFPDLQIRRQLRGLVSDGMEVPVNEFPYCPLGEHQVFLCRQELAWLEDAWHKEQVRMIYPTVELITPTLIKLRQTGFPAPLLILKWPRQPWYWIALGMAGMVQELPYPLEEVWTAQKPPNPD